MGKLWTAAWFSICLLVLGAKAALAFEILLDLPGEEPLVRIAADRTTDTYYVFTADRTVEDGVLPTTAIITQYRRDGIPLVAFPVPREPLDFSHLSAVFSYDPIEELFLHAIRSTEAQESITEFNKSGEVVRRYRLVDEQGRYLSFNGIESSKDGTRYLMQSEWSPPLMTVIAVQSSNLRDGILGPDDYEVVFETGAYDDVFGWSTRDYQTGKFFSFSGYSGILVELNRRGRIINSYSFEELGFGRQNWLNPPVGGGYWPSDLSFESDGSLLLQASHSVTADNVVDGQRVLRFARREWRSLKDTVQR